MSPRFESKSTGSDYQVDTKQKNLRKKGYLDSVQHYMDKKSKKYKDDYSLRTLAYYQREGGIYNELITILHRVRSKRSDIRLLAPNKILNLASEAYDTCIRNCTGVSGDINTDGALEPCLYDIVLYANKDHLLNGYSREDRWLVLNSLCVLLAQEHIFHEEMIPLFTGWLEADKDEFRVFFDPLLDRLLTNEPNEIEAMKKLLASKDKMISLKDSEIANLSSRNSELEKKVATMEPVYDAYIENIVEGSDYDQYLTLDTILHWAKKRKHYKLADQVITMLKDLGRKAATDEELEKIESVESELLSKYSELSIVNNNMGIGSNILTGLTQNPMMPFGVTPEQLTQRFIEFINNGARRENKD